MYARHVALNKVIIIIRKGIITITVGRLWRKYFPENTVETLSSTLYIYSTDKHAFMKYTTYTAGYLDWIADGKMVVTCGLMICSK